MENKKVKSQLKKGFWKPEDSILKNYVEAHGEGNWATISEKSGLMRGGKSCRLWWKKYLRPNLKRGGMSEEKEDLIIRMHKLLGNRRSLIAGPLPGRTDNEVKNYRNAHLNKRCSGKIKSIDPNNHVDCTKSGEKIRKPGRLCNSQTACITSSENAKYRVDAKKMVQGEDRVADTNTMQNPVSFNYDVASPMLPPYSPTYVCDDEPFTAYWDSFVFLEAYGCSDDITYTEADNYSCHYHSL